MDAALLRRYSRQILLTEIGVAGQEKLLNAKILIVGLGGLGSPVAQYLAGAGIGTLGLSEFDVLQLHNLQRQTLYNTDGLGKNKLDLAIARLHAINPNTKIIGHPKLNSDNAAELLGQYDLLMDATDNFASRYLISDSCVAAKRPWVWGAAVRWEGMVSLFDHNISLRDFFPDPPEQQENCDTLGVHGPLLGVVGSMMAGQAIKHLLGLETLYGQLWLFDALDNNTRKIKMRVSER